MDFQNGVFRLDAVPEYERGEYSTTPQDHLVRSQLHGGRRMGRTGATGSASVLQNQLGTPSRGAA